MLQTIAVRESGGPAGCAMVVVWSRGNDLSGE